MSRHCPVPVSFYALCTFCQCGFWCPYHNSDDIADDCSEYEENRYLRSRNETLELENEKLIELRRAVDDYVKNRTLIDSSPIGLLLTDTYKFGRLKVALKISWG